MRIPLIYALNWIKTVKNAKNKNQKFVLSAKQDLY